MPLHERVNTHGFALLLPNGTPDGEGNRFWNPTDQCCDLGKTGEDDVAYLTELVARARTVRDFGPVYFFGYSSGGFMSYHMACKSLPGLRAMASLAGTSYVEDSSCEGDEIERNATGDGEPAFYAGARDMVMRWSRRAGCDWPEYPQPDATLDLDRYVPGPDSRHSAWSRAARREPLSSSGWARAAAIHQATATPSWTRWQAGCCHKSDYVVA